jgi:hypothetical protein
MKKPVLLSLPIMACLTASASTLHVWLDSPSPEPPYTNWASAAHTIQSAVDMAQPGDTVLVTNGVYALDGRAIGGTLTNRVAIDRAITVRSVKGPEWTVIEGAEAPGGGHGEGAFRCAYVGTNAVLSGFTLRNGYTRESGRITLEQDGGGAWCESLGLVTNCLLTANWAAGDGGGALGGTLRNCTLTDNTSAGRGGGARNSTLRSCILIGNSAGFGGGAHGSQLNNCVLTDNSASTGGGAQEGGLFSCVLTRNTANAQGGGAFQCTLHNCALTANTAAEGGGACQGTLYNCSIVYNSAGFSGGGVSGSTNQNCILYYNAASIGPNHVGAVISYSCTTPLPANGQGNLKNEPGLVDPANGDLHLRLDSVCIDVGTNLSTIITNDLNGQRRPLDGDGDGLATFDIGASEFDLRGLVTDEWLLSFGLDPNDPLVFSSDPDNDTYTTLDEWLAETNPTNTLSYFRIESISNVPPLTVYFQSATNRLYSLLYSPKLVGDTGSTTPWRKLPDPTAQLGTGGRLGLSDTNPVSPRFYRVNVELP